LAKRAADNDAQVPRLSDPVRPSHYRLKFPPRRGRPRDERTTVGRARSPRRPARNPATRRATPTHVPKSQPC